MRIKQLILKDYGPFRNYKISFVDDDDVCILFFFFFFITLPS